jgi:cytidine deaminase
LHLLLNKHKMKIQKEISIEEIESEEQLSSEDAELLNLARKSTEFAYAPYSRFYVGAALKLENGKIITGNNQENMAYPSGLCAERVAVFSAASNNKGLKITTIAITAKSDKFNVSKPVYPCGGCRQVLAEYEKRQGSDIRLILSGNTGKIAIVSSVKSLLPFMFEGLDSLLIS